MQSNFRCKRLNLLASHFYLQQRPLFWETLLALTPYARVLIDSGAFSNFAARAKALQGLEMAHPPVQLPDYITACQRLYHGRVWQYIAFDVVRDAARTRLNLQTMLDAGLRPMPVLVLNADVEAITELVTINPYICMAGGVTENEHYLRQRYTAAYERSGRQARIRALGYAHWPSFFSLPLASGDVSSWNAGGRYGHLKFYRRDKGLVSAGISQWAKTNSVVKADILRHFQRYCHVTPEILNDPQYRVTHQGLPALTVVAAYVHYLQHCHELGRDLYLAIDNISWFAPLFGVLANLDYQGFDYPAARALSYELLDLQHHAFPRFCDTLVALLRERTECAP